MKIIYILIITFILSFQVCAQDSFVLKKVDSKKLKLQFEQSNYETNIILNYFKENYKAVSKKLDIKLDPDFDNKECGFTMKFEHGIEYTYLNCGEAKPVEKKIILPKTDKVRLQKWIENINNAYPMDIKNVWYKGENEYGPENEEAGCYYKILPSEKNSIIEIWCGS